MSDYVPMPTIPWAPPAHRRRSYIGYDAGKLCYQCEQPAQWIVVERLSLAQEHVPACNQHA